MTGTKDVESKRKKNLPVPVFVLISLAAFCLFGIGSFLDANAGKPLFIAGIVLIFIISISVLVRKLVLGPARQAGWGFVEPSLGIRKLKWQDITGFVSASLVLLGLVSICVAAGWRHFFSIEKNVTFMEGAAQPLPFPTPDSLVFIRFKEILYPDSKASISDYQTLVLTSVEGEFAWDTAEIRVNYPLRSTNKRIYYESHDYNSDSFYLHFDLKYPGGLIIPYEFRPDGVISDTSLLPFIIALDSFRIDLTHIVDVPEVVVNIFLPQEHLATKKMRAPDSLAVGPYVLYFNYIRTRQTVTLRCVIDESWKLALAGCSLLLVGLILGLVSRARGGFGGKGD